MAHYPFNHFHTSMHLGGVAAAGVVGAAVTGAVAAARDLRKVKEGEMDKETAIKTVAKEALGGGLAVAAGAAVAKTLFRTSPLGFVAMLAVGVGAKYAYDTYVSKCCCCCAAPDACAETAEAEEKPKKGAKAAKKESAE